MLSRIGYWLSLLAPLGAIGASSFAVFAPIWTITFPDGPVAGLTLKWSTFQWWQHSTDVPLQALIVAFVIQLVVAVTGAIGAWRRWTILIWISALLLFSQITVAHPFVLLENRFQINLVNFPFSAIPVLMLLIGAIILSFRGFPVLTTDGTSSSPTESARLSVPLSQHSQQITEEEQQVLELLSKGLSNPEIADRLGASPVHTSLLTSGLLEKFGVDDKVELVKAAQEKGDLPPT